MSSVQDIPPSHLWPWQTFWQHLLNSRTCWLQLLNSNFLFRTAKGNYEKHTNMKWTHLIRGQFQMKLSYGPPPKRGSMQLQYFYEGVWQPRLKRQSWIWRIGQCTTNRNFRYETKGARTADNLLKHKCSLTFCKTESIVSAMVAPGATGACGGAGSTSHRKPPLQMHIVQEQ